MIDFRSTKRRKFSFARRFTPQTVDAELELSTRDDATNYIEFDNQVIFLLK